MAIGPFTLLAYVYEDHLFPCFHAALYVGDVGFLHSFFGVVHDRQTLRGMCHRKILRRKSPVSLNGRIAQPHKKSAPDDTGACTISRNQAATIVLPVPRSSSRKNPHHYP